MIAPEFVNTIRNYVQDASSRSFVPYSGQPRAALALLSNGDWICGVRIENACYPLVIPALSSAVVSAASIGRRDIMAIIFSGSVKHEEKTAALHLVDSPLEQVDNDLLKQIDWIPSLRKQLTTCKDLPDSMDSAAGILLARQAAEYAHTPESNFPVGAIAMTKNRQYFQGANVESPDWRQIICAERAAIAAAISAGASDIEQIYVSCLKSSIATPCGACRQVLYEIDPNSVVWMDRGEKKAECFRIHELLPEAFHMTESYNRQCSST